MDWEKKLKQIESVIELGQLDQASQTIQKLMKRKVPRRFQLPLAVCCRSVHHPEWSINILYRTIYTQGEISENASDLEKAEYGAAMNAIGRSEEAAQILSTVNTEKAPKALLYYAYINLWQWDWGNAIPWLGKFINHPRAEFDATLWAKIFLAQSLTHLGLTTNDHTLELKKAEDLLKQTIEVILKEKKLFLLRNAYLILLQNQIIQQKYAKAAATAKTIKLLLAKNKDPLLQSILTLWVKISHLGKNKTQLHGRTKAHRELRLLRKRFEEQGLWENRRAADYYESIYLVNKKMLIQLYYGTPYPAVKNRILHILSKWNTPLPYQYHWTFFSNPVAMKKNIGPIPNLHFYSNSKFQNIQNEFGLRPMDKRWQLLQCLASDFYRPQTVALIHQKLFPSEIFGPDQSANKVHQIIKRARTWLQNEQIPLEISEKNGLYLLSATGPITITFYHSLHRPEKEELLEKELRALQQNFRDQKFLAKQASLYLGIPLRTCQRKLSRWSQNTFLHKRSLGRKTYYYFK